MAKILLIEDEDALREIVTFNVENAGHTIVGSDNANDALMILEDFLPDLILLDIMLPGLKGDQFLSLIRANAKFAGISVIVISAKSSEEDIVDVLEAGADDYLTKPFSMKILLAKILVVLKRSRVEETGVLVNYEQISVDETSHKAFVAGQEITLTNKEFALLLLFVKHPRRVFTRNQLLNTIWGYDADVFTRTVDSHISTLRKKLGESGQVIKSIAKIGYKVE
ncbi:MAG: winged helix-turn-helix domain-containing protein [Deltaproteobacteria bacterium]|nr:winged helix-turn-helix domain-containing protein [Deltaproteobacteria bacterium]